MPKLFAALAILVLALAAPAAAEVTQWRIRSSEGLDALLLIGAAGGDIMQAEQYPEEIAWARAHMGPDGLAAMAALDAALRQQGALTGPTLANVMSAGPTDTLADLIASAEAPERLLRPGLEAAPDWDEAEYRDIVAYLPHVAAAMRALDAAGYVQWREQTFGAAIEEGLARTRAAVEGYDVIAENQRYLARRLDPQIEIIVLAFCKPYGIRIKGQRFITHYSWDANVQLRTAGHEIFHAPYDENDWRLWARLEHLRADPWMNSIVANHDPRFGYNSFEGVVNEDSTQALDQLVAERLGVNYPPGQRWRRSDGGMHMLAAALYHAMQEDGYDRAGGDYSEWLSSALDRGLLTPAEVRRRATQVVGAETVDQWDRALSPPQAP